MTLALGGLLTAQPAAAATPTTITVTTDPNGPVLGYTGFRAGLTQLPTRVRVNVAPPVDGRVCFDERRDVPPYEVCLEVTDGQAESEFYTPPGQKSYSAVFTPSDPAYASSRVSKFVQFTIPRLTLTTGASPVVAGQAVTLSAVKYWDSIRTSARVTFYAGSTEIGEVSPREASTFRAVLPVGNHVITARFTDPNFGVDERALAYVTVLPTSSPTPAPVAVTSTSPTFRQGQLASAAVALVEAPGVPTSQLSAVISWGDGTSSAGVLAGPSGRPAVFGAHAYAASTVSSGQGTWRYPVSVYVTGPDGTVYSAGNAGAVAVSSVSVPVSGTSR
ncbi:hypothetical protein [Motilibacter deserti]|uniref:Bacterial Ig-like domain-containing protein n=1 Tax=Motilibacter deserti TaxID=2714956 RepID=A0ABX0GWG3_9ACTN|nr:hypothetical protein [Motilibacter deserti]NHC15142.1 hypothetical protein [Motilibacter deserti]